MYFGALFAGHLDLIRTITHHEFDFPKGIRAIPSKVKDPLPWERIAFMMNSRRDWISCSAASTLFSALPSSSSLKGYLAHKKPPHPRTYSRHMRRSLW
jgi:hypothetical protein